MKSKRILFVMLALYALVALAALVRYECVDKHGSPATKTQTSKFELTSTQTTESDTSHITNNSELKLCSVPEDLKIRWNGWQSAIIYSHDTPFISAYAHEYLDAAISDLEVACKVGNKNIYDVNLNEYISPTRIPTFAFFFNDQGEFVAAINIPNYRIQTRNDNDVMAQLLFADSNNKIRTATLHGTSEDGHLLYFRNETAMAILQFTTKSKVMSFDVPMIDAKSNKRRFTFDLSDFNDALDEMTMR